MGGFLMVKEKVKRKKMQEEQKWFAKEDLQDLAKIGGEFLKKKVVSGIDVFKEVKENLPKEASSLINKGKEELLKGLSQETARNLISFTVEKFFKMACEHRIEFSIRIRRGDEQTKSYVRNKQKKEE
jgi:hypothetical protein